MVSVFARFNRCEFCSRLVKPNRPGVCDQWTFVGPARGQARVIACMSWDGLKPGRAPCGFTWHRVDALFRDHPTKEDEEDWF